MTYNLKKNDYLNYIQGLSLACAANGKNDLAVKLIKVTVNATQSKPTCVPNIIQVF